MSNGKKANVGGHYYPGCEDDDDFFTSDCEHGCRCWMGSSRSGGPDGVDPFGACPNNEGIDCRKPTPFQEALGVDNQQDAEERLTKALQARAQESRDAELITRYTWGGGCNDCQKRITIINNELYPGLRFYCPYCGSHNTSMKLMDQKDVDLKPKGSGWSACQDDGRR